MDKKSFLLGTLTGVMTRGQILSHATRISKNNLDQNALEFLAFGKDLIGDRLRLEFLE